MFSLSKLLKIELVSVVALMVAVCLFRSIDGKLLRRSRYYDDIGSGFDGPYGGGGIPMATGERAIMTVRGARSPYDGSAPSKIAIEDNPYRGPYPRGVYDRLDGYGGGFGGGRAPIYPRNDPYGYGPGGYGGRMSGYGPAMFGAPNRIAVTGAFPYGYGSRF